MRLKALGRERGGRVAANDPGMSTNSLIVGGRRSRTGAAVCVAQAVLGALVLTGVVGGCTSADKSTQTGHPTRIERAVQTKADFLRMDPGLQRFFDTAAGWAIFPSVGKGGFIVAGGHGEGVVYESPNRIVGYTELTQVSVGATVGGQGFREIIFFKTPADLAVFKRGEFEMDAKVSAVAIKAGASGAADWSGGVAVFIQGEAGLMADASVGGQKFSYTPIQ